MSVSAGARMSEMEWSASSQLRARMRRGLRPPPVTATTWTSWHSSTSRIAGTERSTLSTGSGSSSPSGDWRLRPGRIAPTGRNPELGARTKLRWSWSTYAGPPMMTSLRESRPRCRIRTMTCRASHRQPTSQ